MPCKAFNRLISLILVIAMMLTMVSGCASHTPQETGATDITIDTQAIVDQIIDDLVEDNDQTQYQPLVVSTNWEDYVGDIETFVYGLLAYQLEDS